MLNNLSIAKRMTVLIVAGAGLVLTAVVLYTYGAGRHFLEQELEAKSRALAQATANRIETVETGVAKVAQSLAGDVEDAMDSPTQILHLLERTVSRNEEIFGAAVAYAPQTSGTQTKYTSPYVCRVGSQLVAKDLGADNYRYDVWDWFTLPRDLGRAVWSEPYYDEGGGNALMVTYSVPVFGGANNNVFRGVVTSDVSLAWLTDLVESLPLGKTGYAFIISANGTFICHPERSFIMKETIFSAADARGDSRLRELGRRMVRGESGFVPYTSLPNNKPCWLTFAPVPGLKGSLGLVFPVKEMKEKVFYLTRAGIVAGVAGLVLLTIITLHISRSIVKPIERLRETTREMATGNLDAHLPEIPGKDEVADLAASFAVMRDRLKEHIRQLQATTAAKERIESEIHIARSIQMSLVPKTFPAFPDHKDFDLHAILEPAREVGGDFYDFFMYDAETLCFVIGDVSGKGVPAALFMAVTRTFLKSIWREEKNPAATVARLNDELSNDNETSMFVTLFCANVHLPTGRCRYVRAGHNPPFVIHPDGQVEQVPWADGPIVGVFPGVTFEENEVTLKHDDMLYLYTDGVTEAMNPQGQLFGEERTVSELRRLHTHGCEKIPNEIREILRQYAAGAEQSDDITMLLFQYLA